MIDNSPPAPTQSAPPLLPADKNTSKDAGPKVKPKKEEDSDGVIQCICNYPGDDGYTVECEECQTWQHIECYYPGRRALEEEFRHSCAVCKPTKHRDLDVRRAAERMSARRAPLPQVDEGPHDKRTKRASSKSHKKKTKPTDLQLNGHAVGNDAFKNGSPHDLPPAKKIKTSHKSSQSVSAASTKQSPHSATATKFNHHGHPLSPATTPPDLPAEFESHPSAPHGLVRHGTPFDPVENNTIATLAITNRMASWTRPECPEFREDAGAELDEVVRRKTPSPLDPPLRVDKQEHPVAGGHPVQLPYLITPSAIDIDVPMMELIGVVGLQQDYCRDPGNGYQHLSAPLPFVFFPEHIPLYIDARREGSNARHVRRSCTPNARLVTYLSDDGGWHFWLVSDRKIAANEEITLDWEFHLEGDYDKYMKRLLGLDEEPGEQSIADVVANIDEKDYSFLDQWITLLMDYYLACACNRGPDCAFSQFRRLYNEKLRANGIKRKRAKSKAQAISPTSTGQATNSRAASEGHIDESPANVDNATLGSALYDKPVILTEPTEREKRKAEQYAKTFEKLEQQPPRKKKRTVPDGSTTTNPSVSKSKRHGSASHAAGKTNGASERRPGDARGSISNAGSPTSAAASPVSVHYHANDASRHHSVASDSGQSSSSASRNYCDTSVQTEPEPADPSPAPQPRRTVVSLTRRLMMQRRRETLLAKERSMNSSPGPPIKSSQSSPSSVYKELPLASPSPATAGADTAMSDAPPIAASHHETDAAPCDDTGFIPIPIKVDSPDLRAPMPPVPAFASPVAATAATTPVSAKSSVVPDTVPPSPVAPKDDNAIGVATAVSPVKEKQKFSLQEYKKRKKEKEAMETTAAAKDNFDLDQPIESTTQNDTHVSGTTNGDHKIPDEDTSTDLATTEVTAVTVS